MQPAPNRRKGGSRAGRPADTESRIQRSIGKWGWAVASDAVLALSELRGTQLTKKNRVKKDLGFLIMRNSAVGLLMYHYSIAQLHLIAEGVHRGSWWGRQRLCEQDIRGGREAHCRRFSLTGPSVRPTQGLHVPCRESPLLEWKRLKGQADDRHAWSHRSSTDGILSQRSLPAPGAAASALGWWRVKIVDLTGDSLVLYRFFFFVSGPPSVPYAVVRMVGCI